MKRVKAQSQPTTRLSPGQTIRFSAKDGTVVLGLVTKSDGEAVQVWSEEWRTLFWLPSDRCLTVAKD